MLFLPGFLYLVTGCYPELHCIFESFSIFHYLLELKSKKLNLHVHKIQFIEYFFRKTLIEQQCRMTGWVVGLSSSHEMKTLKMVVLSYSKDLAIDSIFFLDLPFSHLLSAPLNPCYFEPFFVSPWGFEIVGFNWSCIPWCNFATPERSVKSFKQWCLLLMAFGFRKECYKFRPILGFFPVILGCSIEQNP